MTTYFNKKIGLSILLPKQWMIEVIEHWQFRLFGLPELGFEKYFEEYRSTMSYQLAGLENPASDWFDGLIDQSGRELSEDLNKYQLIGEERSTISTQPAYVRQYEWTEEGTGLRLSQLQSLIYKDSSSFYLIDAATLKPLENKYMPIFREILQSTQIIPSNSVRQEELNG